MDIEQSQNLIGALTPLIGYWEYAEDIITNVRNGTISDADVEELAKILSNALNQAKGDEDFVRMTIAYESSNLWKKKEQIENIDTKQDIDITLQLLDTL